MKPIYRKCLKRAALIWAGCFVLFFLIYMLVLLPQTKNKKMIEKKLVAKKQMYDYARKATQEETKVELDEQIENLQNRLKDFVIDLEDSGNLTFDISRMAKEIKVAPPSIEGKDKPKSSEVPDCEYVCENYINIGFTAGFNQFARMLNALERHRPVVFVDKFTITRSKKDDSDHEANMELTVLVRKRQDS
jgi:hypothetical protein